MDSYRAERRNWAKQNSYFRHPWRFISGVVASPLAGAAVKIAMHDHDLVSVLQGAIGGLAVYLLLWGVEFFHKLAWLAPEALNVGADARVKEALAAQGVAEGSLERQKAQTQHYENEYWDAYNRLGTTSTAYNNLQHDHEKLKSSRKETVRRMEALTKVDEYWQLERQKHDGSKWQSQRSFLEAPREFIIEMLGNMGESFDPDEARKQHRDMHV